MSTHYRLMPEWAPQGAVLLVWPHPESDWAAALEEITPVFHAIASAVLSHENLVLVAHDEPMRAELQSTFDGLTASRSLPGRCRVYVADSDDTWARDFGPLTVSDRSKTELKDFRFNAWGGKFPFHKDDALNASLGSQHAFGNLPLQSVDYVLEGGALETDGEGTLLTTTSCLLDPARNGDQTRADVEAVLARELGISRTLWLTHGHLEGDDTDGHIDTLARFHAPDSICFQGCDDPQDVHYEALTDMARELAAFTDSQGQPYRLTPLPWPDPLHDSEGNRLPATYANFLILNEAVLLPVYGVAQDEKALQVLADCFPDRIIHTVYCRPLLRHGGSLHCLTMQLPPGVPV